MPVLGIVTSSAVPRLLDSDRTVFQRIQDLTNWQVEVVVWDQPNVQLDRCDAFIFRSCWDYHHHIDEFYRFLDRLEALHKPVMNPLDAIRRNAHKFYLADLQLRGVPIIPTIFLRKGEAVSLSHILEDNHWEKVVVKPAVSAGSHLTKIAFFSEVKDDQRLLDPLLKERDMMIQPFMPEVQGQGEFSTIFFSNGQHYTVRKTPIDGDFRIQKEFGGIYERAKLSNAQLKQVQTIWEKVNDGYLFGRVDGLFVDGTFLLMELELIEPDLYLDIFPEYEEAFYQSVCSFLDQHAKAY